MVASFVTFAAVGGAFGQILHKIGLTSSADSLTPAFVRNAGTNTDAVVLAVTVAVTTVVWIVATFVTKPEPAPVLEAFYKRVRPGGPGWRRISEQLGFGVEQIPGGDTGVVELGRGRGGGVRDAVRNRQARIW